MPPTLRAVAQEVQLSVGSVSKILNAAPDASFSPATRQRVLEAAERIGYRPNAFARALRSGKTRTVVMALSQNLHLYGPIEALAECLGAHGYDLLVKVFLDNSRLLSGLEDLNRTRPCDAVVLWGRESEVEEQGRLLENLGLPFVVKGRHEETHPDWPQIEFDHEAMMAEAVSRLAELDHHRIAYLGFDADEVFCERLRSGFQTAMERHLGGRGRGDFIAEGPSSPEFNEEQMLHWLSLPEEERPTALVIGSGNAAWEGAEWALAQHGLRIGERPDEIPVVGQSHTGLSLLFGEAWAYQDIGLYGLARTLGERLLLPLVNGENVEPKVVHIQPELRPLPSRRLLDRPSSRRLFRRAG
jgi:LacI family transcriptional regulator